MTVNLTGKPCPRVLLLSHVSHGNKKETLCLSQGPL